MKASATSILLVVLAFLKSAQEASASGPATYRVTFSTRMRPGMIFPISVQLLKDKSSATFSCFLVNDTDGSTIVAAPPTTVVAGSAIIIELQIPQDLKLPKVEYYYYYYYPQPTFSLRVQATGDITIYESRTMTLEEKAFSIFVQTDKAIYKPGQTVNLRALAMNPDLTLLKEPMDVIIRDPNGNGIRQWQSVEGVADSGVIVLSMPTSTQPPLGDWSIEVTLRGIKETKIFTIDEYVLPKFEVKVDVPKYMLVDDPALKGNANAKYTFGKPLTDAQVIVTAKFDYYYSYDGTPQPVLTREGTLDAKGEFNFEFANSELLDLLWRHYNYPEYWRYYVTLEYRQIIVTASITDVRTGQKMGAEESLQVYRNPAKVEFLSISANNYKPGLKYTAHLSVTKQDDTLFENYSSIQVQTKVTYFVTRPYQYYTHRPYQYYTPVPYQYMPSVEQTTSTPMNEPSTPYYASPGAGTPEIIEENFVTMTPPPPTTTPQPPTTTPQPPTTTPQPPATTPQPPITTAQPPTTTPQPPATTPQPPTTTAQPPTTTPPPPTTMPPPPTTTPQPPFTTFYSYFYDFYYPYWQPEEEIVLTEENLILTANGFLPIEVTVPPKAIRISFTASVLGTVAYKTVNKAESPSGNFLQIELQTDKPKVGTNVNFAVYTTEPVKTLTYEVYAKGKLIFTTELVSDVTAGSQSFATSFPVESSMAPNSRVLAFYSRSDGEVVADSISFKVDSSSDNSVSLKFSKDQVKPGEDVDLTISARPNSVVFSLAIDKSVQLLKSGNDITPDVVAEDLIEYDYGSGYHGFWRYMSMCWWPYPSQGSDAASIFEDANVAIITDGLVYRKPVQYPYYGPYMDMMIPPMPMAMEMAMPMTMPTMMMRTGAPAPTTTVVASASPAVERVRSFFPETWIFDFVILESSGQVVQRKTAPDTITTWMTTAFAIHPHFGLSIIPEPAKLTTFRDVFVSLDRPYSAIRGEDLCMKAFAFNYYNQSITATLTMGLSDGLSSIIVAREKPGSKNLKVRRAPTSVTNNIGIVPTDQVGETTFCFTPTKLGYIPLRVNLTTTTVPGDGVEEMLLIEPEGVPRSESVSVILDVNPKRKFAQKVPIVFPDDVVKGSQRITLSVTGDLMGPVYDNLGDLLHMPYGCGEQNMLNFAPNVFLINYLQLTNTYTAEVAARAEEYMLTGYQREIQYQHFDGSYSAFGQNANNDPGSMWLTAFVTKCFVQSMKLKGVVTIEPNIVKRSLLWMSSIQLESGEFPEPGIVYHREMQGGSATGEALTAYALITLMESNSLSEDQDWAEKDLIQRSIARCRQYLEDRLTTLNDSYDVAIVTYALHLAHSSLAETAFGLLNAKAIREPLILYWERPKEAIQPTYYSWESKTDAINIEMTAYALMTYIARGDLAGALPIVRWMTAQRGPEGGFISTQDTVVGLQALSEVAAIIYKPTMAPVTVTFKWPANKVQETQTFTINDTTKILLQQVDLPIIANKIPSMVTISAVASVSSGFAVAQVALNYNVLDKTNFTTYSLVHEVQMTDPEAFCLKLNASRVDGKVGGMTIIEVGIPTGYTVDTTNPDYDVYFSRLQEVKGRNYVLYFNEMGPDPVIITVCMTVSKGIPINLQPAPLRIYDYYDNGGSKQLISSYELAMLKSNFICDRQPDYKDCNLM